MITEHFVFVLQNPNSKLDRDNQHHAQPSFSCGLLKKWSNWIKRKQFNERKKLHKSRKLHYTPLHGRKHAWLLLQKRHDRTRISFVHQWLFCIISNSELLRARDSILVIPLSRKFIFQKLQFWKISPHLTRSLCGDLQPKMHQDPLSKVLVHEKWLITYGEKYRKQVSELPKVLVFVSNTILKLRISTKKRPFRRCFFRIVAKISSKSTSLTDW